MDHVKKWIKQLLCDHKVVLFVRNVYGDDVGLEGGKRSVWVCCKCDKTIRKNDLYRVLEDLHR
jgi:hypothetical protein